MIEQNPLSPCRRVCRLDEHDVCVGCLRTREEIARWRELDPAARRRILAACRARAESRGSL